MSFPLNSNQPYIKDTGERSTLGAELSSGGGGGTSELPEYSVLNAGQVLTVGSDGKLKWAAPATSGNRYINANVNSVKIDAVSNVQEVTS